MTALSLLIVIFMAVMITIVKTIIGATYRHDDDHHGVITIQPDSLSNQNRAFLLQVGALVVKDVKPYEFMKLRLLNGGHSCLSYLSVLCGYNYVDDAMADPLISRETQQ